MNGITIVRRPVTIQRTNKPVSIVAKKFQQVIRRQDISGSIPVTVKEVAVRKTNQAVTILERKYQVTVTAQVPILHKQTFKQFFLVAIQGQSVFTLPSYCIANGMIFLAINGTGQSPIRGDFTTLGNQLTLGASLIGLA